MATLHAEEDQAGGIIIDLPDDGNAGSAGILATVTDLDNPSPETITEFRIDLSAYPEGSFVALTSTNPDSGTVNDLGTGSYSITAIVVDADAGTYRLPKGLSLSYLMITIVLLLRLMVIRLVDTGGLFEAAYYCSVKRRSTNGVREFRCAGWWGYFKNLCCTTFRAAECGECCECIWYRRWYCGVICYSRQVKSIGSIGYVCLGYSFWCGVGYV